jgi:hypothetical protein
LVKFFVFVLQISSLTPRVLSPCPRRGGALPRLTRRAAVKFFVKFLQKSCLKECFFNNCAKKIVAEKNEGYFRKIYKFVLKSTVSKFRHR